MPLPESYWPRKKLGELSPTTTVTAYEWYYFSIPRGVPTVARPVGMEEFTPKEIQRVFAPAADYARTLAKHGVDLIVQGGVPLPCVMGARTSSMISSVACVRRQGSQQRQRAQHGGWCQAPRTEKHGTGQQVDRSDECEPREVLRARGSTSPAGRRT